MPMESDSESEISLPLFVSSRDEALTVKKTFEQKTGISYTIFRKYKGKEEISSRSIHFVDKSGVVKETEHPFLIVKTDVYECMYGRDRHVARKLKEQAKDEERLMVNKQSEWERRLMSKTIRSVLDKGEVQLTQEHRVYIKYPTEEAHRAAHELGPPPPRKKPKMTITEDIRKDGVNHFPLWNNSRQRCKLCPSGVFSFVKCTKCNVHLCLNKTRNCFLAYHK